MEILALLPWILLTLVTSLLPAVFAHRFSPWWKRHGDVGEAIGTSLVAGTAIFTVAFPILNNEVQFAYGILAIVTGIALALLAHHFFERDGQELAVKSWFVAIAFALHNFPEGVASARALVEQGTNIFSLSILTHNIVDALVMTLGLMAMGLSKKHLFFALTFAALGEVLGMLVAGFGLSGLAWISLISVGALIGLAIDSIIHWSNKQVITGFFTIVALFFVIF